MTDAHVSDAEKERLLAEFGGAPSAAPVRPAPAPESLVRSASVPAAAPAPRAPSRLWPRRRLLAAVVMLTAGAAWIAAWMVSGRPAAAGLALLGVAGGAWLALRPKKY